MVDKMTLDDIFKVVGEFGPMQKFIYVLYSLSFMVTSMQLMSWEFVGANLPHRCRLADELDSTTATFDGELSDSTCQMALDNGSLSDCKHGYVYNTSLIGDSVVKEWNLVCEKSHWRPIIAAAPMIGYLFGGILLGQFTDQFGRKPAFLLSICILLFAGFLGSVSPGILLYIVSRFLTGFAKEGTENSAYIMALEIVGPKKRALAAVFCWIFEDLGLFCTVGIAYFLHDHWRNLQSIYAFICVFFLSYYWITPESMRWFLSKNKCSKAIEIVTKVAKSNGNDISEELLNHLKAAAEEEYHQSMNKNSMTMLDLFKHKQLRNKSLINAFIWIVCFALYYVFLLDQSDLSTNPFLGFLITSVVQIPSIISVSMVLELTTFGRKRTLCASLILCGIGECLVPFMPADCFIARTIASTVSRFFAMCACITIYLFSTEQYPTVVRGIGLGFCATCGRIGSFAAPFILLIGRFSSLVFGILSILAALASLALPETADVSLPESIEDGELIPVNLYFKHRKTCKNSFSACPNVNSSP